MTFDSQAFQDMYRMAVETPMTLIIGLTIVGSISTETAETITELIRDSGGKEEWYELLLSASSISIGRAEN